jgi:hypothetical protein
MAVPVLNEEYKALYPFSSERRARLLMEKGAAKPYWRKGIFCILLLRKESEQREEYKDVVVGIDTGSKREGYTVATEKSVVLNITTNTPDWVKDSVETRRNLRRARRQRKTPYRKCRGNRSKKSFLAPSTKARWDCKLRILKFLTTILPITKINIEDVAAKTLENSPRWNKSFSPLEYGKTYFYNKIEELHSNIVLIKTKGFDTKTHRDSRGFVKSSKKLDYIWEAHNVDSHSLCEMVLEKPIRPFYGMYRIDFLKYNRRQLHVQNPTEGNVRKKYGGTVSLGISRGSLTRYKNKLVYIGGTSNGKVSIHSIITGERLSQNIKKEKLTILNNSKHRTQFLPRLKSWVSLLRIS